MSKMSDDTLEVNISSSKIGGRDSFYGHPGEVIFHTLEDTMAMANFDEQEKAEYIALSSRLKQVGKELTAKGQSHDNGFFESYFSISGAFDSPEDQFKEGRNAVQIHARLPRDWKEYAAKCKVHTQATPQFAAQVVTAENFTGNSTWDDQHNLAVQAGNVIILHGEHLKVSGLNSGLELLNITTGKKSLIDRFPTNLPKELQFPFPSLAAGQYSVTLKTYFRAGIDYAEQKTVLLTLQFTVT